MASLEGKVVLITGAGSGLGQSHAALLSERGTDVIVQDRDGDGAETTAGTVRGNGRKAHVMVGDVRDSRGFAQSAAEAIAGDEGKYVTGQVLSPDGGVVI